MFGDSEGQLFQFPRKNENGERLADSENESWGACAASPDSFEAIEWDLSELVHPGQKVCLLGLLCREGLLYFQGLARPRKPRTQDSPPVEERDLTDPYGGRMGATAQVGEGATFWFTVPVRAPD